jgi:hypothetical protein
MQGCRDRHRDGCRVRVRGGGGGRGRGWRRGRLAGKVDLRDFTSSEVSKPMEHLCCVVPVSWRDIDASRFWSLQTRLNGDSEVSCAPESYPLVDVGLQFFAVDDGVEYPPADDKPFPDDLPRPQAMRGPTWVVREKCRARCVHARIVDPWSLSLYAPGSVPVCEPLTRFAVHCMSRLRVDTEAASLRPGEKSLVDIEPLKGRAAELVAGVSQSPAPI